MKVVITMRRSSIMIPEIKELLRLNKKDELQEVMKEIHPADIANASIMVWAKFCPHQNFALKDLGVDGSANRLRRLWGFWKDSRRRRCGHFTA